MPAKFTHLPDAPQSPDKPAGTYMGTLAANPGLFDLCAAFDIGAELLGRPRHDDQLP